MNRKIAVTVLVVVGLSGLLGWRLLVQDAALGGPTRGSGVVEGTTVRLVPKLAARVLSHEVEEGQQVEAGTLLVQLDCADAEAMLAEAEARLASGRAQAAAAAAQADAAGGAASAARRAAEAARSQAAALETQAQAAARQATRVEAVDQDVSASMVDQARSAADGLGRQADAAIAQGDATSAQARAAGDQQAAAAASAEAASLSVDAADKAVERARLAVAECQVVAPRAGIVELLPYEAGELVPMGGEVARIVDISTVTASFYVPNAELGAVQVDGKASLVADAWIDQEFAGRVRKVSTEAEFTPRNIQTRSDRDRLVYRVEVVVDNPDGKLRPGMPVTVTLAGTQ